MKKTLLALALITLTYGAFAQSAPAKQKPAMTAKTDTAKHAKAVKQVKKKKAKM